jgi:ABC-type transport system involved in multi-copper enzyme maturation permease subunit
MRGARAFVILTVYLLLLGGGVSLAFVPLSSLSGGLSFDDIATRQLLGRSMFGTAVFLQLVIIGFVAPGITAGSITAEREHQTFDILRTTLLSARELVTGKFVAALSFLFLLLLAAFPIQSLAFMFGGITMQEVAVAALMLLATAVAFSAIGIFLSSWLRRTLLSTVLAYSVSIFAVIGTPILTYFLLLLLPLGGWIFGYGGNLDIDPITVAVLIAVGLVLVSSNPILAATLSEALFLSDDSIWYVSIPLPSGITLAGLSRIPLPSPWLGYVVGYLLLSLILIHLSIRLVRRPDS